MPALALLGAGFRQDWLLFPFAFLGCFLGFMGGLWLFAKRIHARCEVCGGSMFPRGKRPIRYVCINCGHTKDTGIYEKHARWGS